jgi:MFS superfamily sulfate permease-like transporter
MLAVAAARPLLGEPGIGCPLRALTGVPCPLCGMTRGVTSAVHGDLVGALRMNPGSVVLVAMVVAVLVGWRWRRTSIPRWTVPVAVAALWAYQLFKLSTGHPL